MKILYVTTVSTTMDFFPEHIRMLQEQGHTVDLATNLEEPLTELVSPLNCNTYHIPFSRNPLNQDNLKAYREMKKLVADGGYDIVHTHTPNASVITRLVCRKLRKQGLKVIYTAHGFHFYKGAPLKNWLVFYPVEKLCARMTDAIVTINREDYLLAQQKLHAKRACYIPGVGLDLNRFHVSEEVRENKRRELGLESDEIVLISVGELNRNKNQIVILQAMGRLKNPKLRYLIAGVGDCREKLEQLSEELGIEKQVQLLGHRDDVAELYCASDICCFPSFREGLGMAALEGMACGLPLIAADNRGTRDYCTNGENAILCAPNDVEAFKNAIEDLAEHPEKRKAMGEKNCTIVKNFSTQAAVDAVDKVYEPYFAKR